MPAIKVPIERLRKRIASFRCSAAEYQQLEDAASRADVPLSDWLRSTTLEIAGGDRWPAPGTVLKVGDGEAGDAISVDIEWQAAPPPEPPPFEPTELEERVVEVPVGTAAAPVADTGYDCPACDGLGPRHSGHVCPRCNGTAWISPVVALTPPWESAGDTPAELSSEVAIAAAPEGDVLKAYIEPAVAAASRQMEADVSNLYAQFELPLTWADHWAQIERMEPGEATERLYELAAGRRFDPDFPRWSKARKIKWLEEAWPL